MTFFANRNLNHLVVHATLNSLAFCFSGVFSALFLLGTGLSLPEVFLVFGAILSLRFVFRPFVLMTAPAIGLRRTLMLGTLLTSCQFPVLAMVHGVGPALVAFCVLAALGQVFYWTSYHAFFTALGDTELRGSQIAERQMLGAVAGVFGPAAGGILLAAFGPWPAFMTASAIQIIAVVPLHYICEPRIVRVAPRGIFVAARRSIKLFACDGWIVNSSMTAWSIIMFQSLGSRYDAFGGLLAAAALAGAVSGMLLGRLIDRGHALRLTWANGAIMAGSIVLRSICGEEPLAIILVALGTTIVGGLYIPSLMTAVYNEAKLATCPLRFHFAAEGGWDAGGMLACVISAMICAAGLPLQMVMLLGLPIALWQTRVLMGSYSALSTSCLGPVGKRWIASP